MTLRSAAVAMTLLASAAGLLLVYRFDPATSGLFPPCLFHALTGWHCPGCGSLRALHALLHGDLRAAFGYNPLLLAMSPILLVGGLRESYRIASGEDRRTKIVPAWAIRALLVVIVAFGVLRNLPGFARLAPGHARSVSPIWRSSSAMSSPEAGMQPRIRARWLSTQPEA